MATKQNQMSLDLLADLAEEFFTITGLHPRYDRYFEKAALSLCDHLSKSDLQSFDTRKKRFIAHVNWKFRINSDNLKRFYAKAARQGFTFNYHKKSQIQLAYDSSDITILLDVLNQTVPCDKVKEMLLDSFDPVSPAETLGVLQNECGDPTKLRRPKGKRDIAKEILQSQFGAFLFCSLEPKHMHAFFDPCYSPENYCENFWDELHLRAPQLFNREHALYILNVDKKLMNQLCDYLNLRNRICSWLANAYQELNNYSYLALLISPIHIDGRSVQYELAADAVLYGEKHRELPLKKAYFRWKEIQETTGAYISGIDSNEARFDLANEGFTYKDCFVIAPSHEAQHSETSLLVVLQKNDRDETLIPCPSCRSQNVQGNSYSSLGVRSWECKNLLCPDRSKYNRGKRYSFRGLLMQQAIDDELNEIPSESVRSWLRDVQVGRSRKQILDMILRHYSLHADTVHIFNWPAADCDAVGRKIVLHSEEEVQGEGRTVGDFYKGPFFSRYIVAPKSKGDGPITELGDESFKVICGDAYETLKGLPPSYFDAAVTSPPYYNARDYSKWDNIYCYLHDMYAIAMEVFRCLKDGSLFLYNIFDYFDNENSLAFSAMGQKRMILSSYTVDMFRRIGFRCNGNIAWDKGDIEGKRGFNAGNYSPYYQAPFNCWEHILIFEKPAPTAAEHQLSINFPAVLRAQPVIKMVRGKNTHGHTAPFPEEIPALITTKLQNGARILDPFGGSLTTGRVAERQGIDSLCIEKHEEYCALGLTMRRDDLKKRSAQQMELGL